MKKDTPPRYNKTAKHQGNDAGQAFIYTGGILGKGSTRANFLTRSPQKWGQILTECPKSLKNRVSTELSHL